MTSIDTLLAEFRTVAPGSPRLTWYGEAGDRIELSGKVLDNWVSKTANFLTEEFDVAPGSIVELDLPAHWKSLCILLAVLACGGTASDLTTSDLLASSNQQRLSEAKGPTIAVALGSLALRWEGELPAQSQDYAAEVRMFADAFDRLEDPQQSQAALELAGVTSHYGDLPALRQNYAVSDRIALDAETGLATVAAVALGVWQAGGSMVLAENQRLITAKLLSSEGARSR